MAEPSERTVKRRIPRYRIGREYVKTSVLAFVKDSSQRWHFRLGHSARWDVCRAWACKVDRKFLGSHGVLGRDGKRLR